MKKLIRVGVTGGRDYLDREKVYDILNIALEGILDSGALMQLVVGDCPTGLDLFARNWADNEPFTQDPEVFEAYWKTQGKAAGPIRNQRMADSGLDILLSFPGNAGTKSMTNICTKAGIPVKKFV